MESNWGSCRCLQVVSIHKFRVYKTVSRPRVDKSSEWDFIKVILTKDQRRSKGNKKWMRIRKSWIGLVAAQRSSMQPSVYVKSWGSLSIFLRVSRKQLLEYQQLLKYNGLWERPWSASSDRSPACGLLHHNRDTDCFWGAFYTCHWSTCHCWPAWKRGSLTEYWVTFWKQGMEMT